MVVEDSGQPAGGLEFLAQARFGELSQAEIALLRAAPKGEVGWCGPTAKDDDPGNDLAKSDDWGPEREIRAELIRWLCVDREAASAVDPKGIQVHAAKIKGALDLSFASVPFPLVVRRCRFTENSNLISTEVPTLNLGGSRVLSVTADGANVRGNVCLSDGFSAEGEVRLLGAQIGGDLNCKAGTFKNPGKNALNADRANVKGGVYLCNGFSAEGCVRLLGAQIGGVLNCGGGTFKNPRKPAIRADRVDVKGSVFLRDGFSAEGEVRLLGAQIGGEIGCRGGTFRNPNRIALNAGRADVKGSVFLKHGFNAEGEVRLLHIRIGSNLDCDGSTLKNPGSKALSADGADVEGSVHLRDGFSAEGEVRLTNAEIRGDFACSGGKFSNVQVQRATIAGGLFWRGFEAAQTTSLDLMNASAGSLHDDEKSWPGKGKLVLDGFVYGHISGESPRDAKTRLRWLERQDPFRPKPYRQLAKVLREAGDDSGARKVLFEMESRRRKVEDRGWGARLWGWVLKLTIGYGFYPRRALAWLVLLTALGWGLFRAGYFSGAMAPTDKDAYCFFRAQGRPPEYYQRFTASVYSLEHALPLVNLGQKDRWLPDPNPRTSQWTTGLLRWFRWGQILLGWLLATLFVAGVTGLVRKD